MTRKDELPAFATKDYGDFRQKVLADEAETIVLQTAQTAASTNETQQP